MLLKSNGSVEKLWRVEASVYPQDAFGAGPGRPNFFVSLALWSSGGFFLKGKVRV